jgi:long-subunit fatty acid transport protein
MSGNGAARRSGAAVVLTGCIVVLASTIVPHKKAFSQGIDRTVEFEDLGFTNPINVGARPAGMAGAYVAAGNDVHALVYNPAGLARLKRIELSLGLQQQRSSVDYRFYGNPSSIDVRDGGMDGAGLAWPLPAYRGGLTLAFGVFRVYSSLLDLHYSGMNQDTQTIDNYLLQQYGSIYSYNLGLGVDLAPTLSGGFSVFLLDGTIGKLDQFDFTFVDNTSVFVKNDITSDVTGFGGRLGVQVFFHELFAGGISFTPPVWATVKGSGTSEITKHVENAPDSFEQNPVSLDDDYILPFRVDFGAAMMLRRLLVEFDFGYSDWTTAAIDRKRFRNPETLDPTFREVFEYKLGAEYTFYRLPMRVRAGYALLPYPLTYLQNDRIDDNALTKAEVERERRLVCVGLGGLIGDVLTVDASLSLTQGKRANRAVEDERSTYRFVLTASYRF